MSKVFNNYPFGHFKLKMGRYYRLVMVFRSIDSNGIGGDKTVITEFFYGKDFYKYKKFFPKKQVMGTSYQLERMKHNAGTHTPQG